MWFLYFMEHVGSFVHPRNIQTVHKNSTNLYNIGTSTLNIIGRFMTDEHLLIIHRMLKYCYRLNIKKTFKLK